MLVMGAVHATKVLGFDEVLSNTKVSIKILLARIVHVPPEHANAVGEVGSIQGLAQMAM
jgi:hypothetical protein